MFRKSVRGKNAQTEQNGGQAQGTRQSYQEEAEDSYRAEHTAYKGERPSYQETRPSYREERTSYKEHPPYREEQPSLREEQIRQILEEFLA